MLEAYKNPMNLANVCLPLSISTLHNFRVRVSVYIHLYIWMDISLTLSCRQMDKQRDLFVNL